MKEHERDHLGYDEKDGNIAAHQPAEIEAALVDQQTVGRRGSRRRPASIQERSSSPSRTNAAPIRRANIRINAMFLLDFSFHTDVVGRAEFVQRQVELEHVDGGLAENPGPSRARMLAHERTDGILA